MKNLKMAHYSNIAAGINLQVCSIYYTFSTSCVSSFIQLRELAINIDRQRYVLLLTSCAVQCLQRFEESCCLHRVCWKAPYILLHIQKQHLTEVTLKYIIPLKVICDH